MTSRSTTASFPFDSFQKILRLERERGYKDTTVVGGLDSFLHRWASHIGEKTTDPLLATELLRKTYTRMAPGQRKEWIGKWLALLGGAENATGQQPDISPALEKGPKTVRTNLSPPLKSRPTKRTISSPGQSLESPVNKVSGVDSRLTPRLERLGVKTVRDLLYLFPRRHNDYSRVVNIADLVPGEEQTVSATLWEAREIVLGQSKRKATEAVLSDETGNVRAIWFGRQPYLVRSLRTNSRIAVSGKVELFKNQMEFQSPDYDLLDRVDSPLNTGRLVPVYPLTEGLTSRNLRRIMWRAMEQWLPLLHDFQSHEVRERLGMMALTDAVMQAHYPDDQASKDAARRCLAFDELFLLQLAVLMRHNQWQEGEQGTAIPEQSAVLSSFLASLPFSFTQAQERCLGEILKDMARSTPPMNRLLQGEVGSGKTVVALAALLAVAASGHQGAIMAPTEILAEQHFHTIARLLSGLARPVQGEGSITVYVQPHPQPISVGLLTGSTKASIRSELLQRASEGTLDIIVGTHALIQEEVEIPNLALAVADEQHRFGVLQRAALREKAELSAHVLVMSATPIPRTLALTLYGDLDISTIDQLPAGRQQIVTRCVSPERRGKAYDFVRQQVGQGRQTFVVCPLIEESEVVEARAATQEYKRLSHEVFPDLRLGLLHGRMASRDKENVMRQFRDGELDVLVSTPVVEVGIDVANATVMLVEGADRFGLAQLHQFRGRVGRGEHKSYCLLLADDPSPEAEERLQAVERIHDGFQLAEVDLSLRGPGDFFGTRQSGLPTLRMARLSDQDLLKMARAEAETLLKSDPNLQDPTHQELAAQVSRFIGQVSGEIS